MKTLVVAPSWIGDTLLAQPLLTLLKRQTPDLRIEVLAPDWSAPLLKRMTEVAAVIANPFAHGEFNFGGRRELGRQLSARGFDSAYVLPNSWKSALVPYFARIPRRVGYLGEARYILLTERPRQDAKGHPQLAQRYAALAGPLTAELANALPRPRLASTAAQQHAARQALGLSATAAPIVFCPGAEYGPAKRWPARHFAALAQRVADASDPVWIMGAASDSALGDEIARLAKGAALNLCGRTTLEQAIDLLAGARHVVCNDSGLMHVAAALDRPLVALYGSSSPIYTPPLSPQARIVSRRLACSPCFKRECPLGHFDCLEGLEPAQVAPHLQH